MKRAWPALLSLLCGACVTVTEPGLTSQSVAKGQRTVLMVFPSPGPWVVTDTESKAESAAKTLPVFSYVVQSLQDERYRTAAADLNQYLPPWKPGPLLEPLLLAELDRSAFPGRFVPAAQTEIGTATLRGWNRADDTLDWQTRYYYEDPAKPHPRDYSRLLSLDDALAFEANLLPSVAADDDGNVIPTLSVSSRLFRCQTMHLLWQHEDKVEDRTGARSLYEFKTLPLQLVDRWKSLMPAMAAQVAKSLRQALNPDAAVPAAPPLPGGPAAMPPAAGPPAPSVPAQTPASPAAPESLVAPLPPPAVSTQTAPAPPLPQP